MSREKFIQTLKKRNRVQTPAYTKYHKLASAGNREAQRRILQSTGYKISIMDCPQWISLLARANILLDNVDYKTGVTPKDSYSSDTIIIA
jgi:hypothetical protein